MWAVAALGEAFAELWPRSRDRGVVRLSCDKPRLGTEMTGAESDSASAIDHGEVLGCG